MDEPFGALDVGTRLEMQNLINQLWEEIEGTILFVTHDIAEAVYLADRIHIFSPDPGTLVDELAVDLPLHRTEDLKETARFRDLEDVLLKKVRARCAAATCVSPRRGAHTTRRAEDTRSEQKRREARGPRPGALLFAATP